MGAPFYVAAYKAVSHGAANMDVLVVLGTTSAWLYGIILILMQLPEEKDIHAHHEMSIEAMEEMHMETHRQIHEHAHNFEISASLITVILLGKYLESLSKKQTVEKLSNLAKLKVTKAMLLKSGKASLSEAAVETDVELLELKDLIKVTSG
jgi:Cu+-exporting ATPase